MNENEKNCLFVFVAVLCAMLIVCTIDFCHNRESTESAGNSQQSTADAYTESRVELERLDATNRELERTVEESAGIFEEIRKQSTNQK